jgi:hypothetical protein
MEKFEILSKYKITLLKWPNEQAWRLGLDWESETDYIFVCEASTAEECLDIAVEFVLKFEEITTAPAVAA